MKIYKVQVCMSYIQVIEIEADSQDSAEDQAFEAFELEKAQRGEGECWTVEVKTKKQKGVKND